MIRESLFGRAFRFMLPLAFCASLAPAYAAVEGGKNIQASAELRLAVARHEQSADDGAFEQTLTNLRKRHAKFALPHLVFARHAAEHSRWAEALAAYKKFLGSKEITDFENAQREFFTVEAALEETDDAKRKQLAQQVWSTQAAVAIEEGRLADAFALAQRAIARNEKDAWPHQLAAQVLLREQQLAGAIAALGRALTRSEPAERPAIEAQLATAQQQLTQRQLTQVAARAHLRGDEEAAGVRYLEAWLLEPKQGKLACAAAAAFLLAQDFEAARLVIELAQMTPELQPVKSASQLEALSALTGDADPDRQGAELHARKAAERQAAGEPKEALVELKEAIQARPNHARYYLLAARIYESGGDAAYAARLYESAAVQAPRLSYYRVQQGEFLLRRKDTKGALRSFRLALSRDSGSITLRRQLATLLVREQQFNEAVEILEPALAELPESAELQSLIGQAHLALKQWQPAVRALRAAVSSGAWQREVGDRLAQALAGEAAELARQKDKSPERSSP